MSGRARWKAYLSASRSMQDGIIIRESTSSRLVNNIAAVQERPQHEPGPVKSGFGLVIHFQRIWWGCQSRRSRSG